MTNIRKVFNEGTVNEKTALDGVSLTVKDGDFVTIIGSNGAGKSTLFNCIGGSFYPDEGSIFLDNQNITYMPEHKRACLLYTSPSPRDKRHSRVAAGC